MSGAPWPCDAMSVHCSQDDDGRFEAEVVDRAGRQWALAIHWDRAEAARLAWAEAAERLLEMALKAERAGVAA